MDNEQVKVEWVILADAAEVVNGKLYVMGGGWEHFYVASGFPVQHAFALGVAFAVPWNQTNQPHTIELVIQDDDGDDLAKIEGEIEQGRPPGIPPGQSQRVQIAIRFVVTLEKAGGYVVIARVDGREDRRVPFSAIDVSALGRR